MVKGKPKCSCTVCDCKKFLSDSYRDNAWLCPVCNLPRCQTCCDCWGGHGFGGRSSRSASVPGPVPAPRPVPGQAPEEAPPTSIAASLPAPPPALEPPSASPSSSVARRSRSPARVAALTEADRGVRYKVAEVKDRYRRQYSRGGADRPRWPLPGRAERPGLRDAVPYESVQDGTWSAGLWLGHVKEMLSTALWTQHHQCWSIREEMFLE